MSGANYQIKQTLEVPFKCLPDTFSLSQNVSRLWDGQQEFQLTPANVWGGEAVLCGEPDFHLLP